MERDMFPLKDWRITDPLGELLKLAGADRLGNYWRMGGVPGWIATGVQPGHGHDPQSDRPWLAVPTRLHPGQRSALIEAGFATSDDFRDIPGLGGSMLVTGLSAFVDPTTTSATDLVTHARELAVRAQTLRGIVKAKTTANRMSALLGARLPDALLPEWDTLTEVRWTDGDGYLATHSGSITYSTWDTLPDEIRRGSPDGIRVRRQGNVVTVAAAAKAASLLIEEETVPWQERSLIDLASVCFVMRLGEIVAGKLARPDDAGNARRLFHVEHTQARGSSVWVFDPWRCGLVQHPQMTALWTALVTDRTDEARRRLFFAARDLHRAAANGIQPIDEQWR